MFLAAIIIGIVSLALGITALVLVNRVRALYRGAARQLDDIAALEVHGREFVDAAQLYAILARPIPDPIDHAANIRTRVGQPPHRSPYT